ncbi:MAG: TonB-dependent receptor [Saprospirales bacterium]|nr:MAG: TonB-dependent receptor [Saprospirales bacterium]
MKNTYIYFIIFVFYLSIGRPIYAVNDKHDGDEAIIHDSISLFLDFPEMIIPGDSYGVFSRVPGSVKRINQKELGFIAPVSANEALRSVPGLQVQEEEGAGLRINLGVRGLDPDRSRNILILEDGIPVALNPYGEPEMYYSPAIDRMSGLELIKGSGQILYGPQTIGGVLNYITPNPPDQLSGQVRMNAGSGGYFSGYGSVGSSNENGGFLLNYLYKRADKLGYVGYDIHDINGKFNFQISDVSSLGVKLGVYREESNSTYIGLTQTMYDAGGQDHVLMAPDDLLVVSKESASLTYSYSPNSNFRLNTTVYGYHVSRNWRRQDFSYDPNVSNQSGVVWGDTSVPGGAVFMRNSTGNRNRSFEVYGIEPRIRWNYNGLNQSGHELRAGARYIKETAYEQRINGSKKDASSGLLQSDEIRTGSAWSAYAQNNLKLSESFSISAGLRLEHYDYKREILRGVFVGEIRDTLVNNSSSTTALIPGLGFNYNHSEFLSLFGGIHRGFSPPRLKDAITASGEVVELDAELSWNTELGARFYPQRAVSGELTFFLMDFSNQIIPVSESSGGTGAGLVNGGETRHYGVEASIFLDLGRSNPAFDLRTASSLTYMKSYFNSDRFFLVNEELINARDNRTPYAPEFTFHQNLDFSLKNGLGVRLSAFYISDRYTDILNTTSPNPNGRSGLIDSHWQMDANLYYSLPNRPIRLNVAVKNLTDNRYIVSRRPQGIRVSTPRFITAGINLTFE